jgi:hypothetical protein
MTYESVLENVDSHKVNQYKEYWNNVAPVTDGEIFQRWLFAYTSIHTTWESNVRAYNHIKNFESWIGDKDKLAHLLLISRAGCHNQRTNYIWDFSSKFWANPERFKKTNRENWFKFRNRLSLELWGIGLAKTSFALELCYPEKCQVVCLDVHMLRLLGMNEHGYKKDIKADVAEYEKGERKWHYRAEKMKAPNYIARCIYWDVKQGYKNSRYWSSCLENQLHFDF